MQRDFQANDDCGAGLEPCESNHVGLLMELGGASGQGEASREAIDAASPQSNTIAVARTSEVELQVYELASALRASQVAFTRIVAGGSLHISHQDLPDCVIVTG